MYFFLGSALSALGTFPRAYFDRARYPSHYRMGLQGHLVHANNLARALADEFVRVCAAVINPHAQQETPHRPPVLHINWIISSLSCSTRIRPSLLRPRRSVGLTYRVFVQGLLRGWFSLTRCKCIFSIWRAECSCSCVHCYLLFVLYYLISSALVLYLIIVLYHMSGGEIMSHFFACFSF